MAIDYWNESYNPIVINNCDLTMSNIISYQLYNGITDATMQVDVKEYNVIS